MLDPDALDGVLAPAPAAPPRQPEPPKPAVAIAAPPQPAVSAPPPPVVRREEPEEAPPRETAWWRTLLVLALGVGMLLLALTVGWLMLPGAETDGSETTQALRATPPVAPAPAVPAPVEPVAQVEPATEAPVPPVEVAAAEVAPVAAPVPAASPPSTPGQEWTVPFALNAWRAPEGLDATVAAIARACAGDISVLGHSCPLGEPEVREAIALARAETVGRALVAAGLAETRVTWRAVPVDEGDAQASTLDERQRARRVVVRCEPSPATGH